jgi:bifunctional non-homologous end joining protein LigD
MSLKKYNAKRDFKKTPEPKGKPPAAAKSKKKSSKNLYIIQKHAASHLHYDFRLELNGVLLSWAVPKGPSLDPATKRLAMHVEDHPVAYGSFEGIIPKGEYGGGTVMLWDKGSWDCEEENPADAYKNGKLTFILHGKKLHGRWKIFRINKDDKTWLLVKAQDEFADSRKKADITVTAPNSVVSQQSIAQISEQYAKIWSKKGAVKAPAKKKIPAVSLNLKAASFPREVFPQLATLVSEPPQGKQWIHEIKFDGYRLVTRKKAGEVSLMTRNNNNWTAKFPTLKKALEKLAIADVILDGELVVLDEKGKSNFQLLQNTLKNGGHPFTYYLFDILYYDKYNVTALALDERKKILKTLLASHDDPTLIYSDHVEGSGKAVFKKACKLGLEGIISKNTDSEYVQKRSENWLKVKCIKRQEFVIGGIMAPREGKRKLIRSLMLGTFNKKKELIYCGNVGTGFTESSIREIYSLLKKYETSKMPFKDLPPASKNALWVKPVIVAEVEFTEWTSDGSLRHPSFKGLRQDKPAKKIMKEKTVNVKKITKK